ncbi:hypothetical protein [Streptomyces griseoluteus]|uniref:hypothetical protein n=1 Tax=Streptomyces griseoluteus TaxID=29306 RepID=UPI0036F62DC1
MDADSRLSLDAALETHPHRGRDIVSPEAPADALLSEMHPAEGMTDDTALVVVSL